MDLQEEFRISDHQLNRFEDMYKRYKMMYQDPANCSPMFFMIPPEAHEPSWRQCLADPLVMLRSRLNTLSFHLAVEDDHLPVVEASLGTGLVASAFGCNIHVYPDSPPAAGSSVLQNTSDVYDIEKPTVDSGWWPKQIRFVEAFLDNLPEGVHICHPDIQSSFNSAHLIRGNDIFLDFYDNPEALDVLLDLVTDYMIELTPYLKKMISTDTEWFFDWGSLYKGAIRISNCTMQMISPELYRNHILPRDKRFMKAVGGGRVHYCGNSGKVIDEFFKIPDISGLDYTVGYHDLWSLAERAPKQLTLCYWGDPDSQTIKKLLQGDWPKKRNIIIRLNVSSAEEAKAYLKRFRQSVC